MQCSVAARWAACVAVLAALAGVWDATAAAASSARRVLPVLSPSNLHDLLPGDGILEAFRDCENANPFFDRTNAMMCTSIVGRLGRIEFPDATSFERTCEALMTPYCRETCSKLMNLFVSVRLHHDTRNGGSPITTDNRAMQAAGRWKSALTISRCNRCLTHDECDTEERMD